MKWNRNPSPQTVPENDSTNAGYFYKNKQYTVMAGANRDMKQTVDFVISIVLGMGKATLCKNIVFGRLLMSDSPKHSLEHCVLRGWVGGQTQNYCSFWNGEYVMEVYYVIKLNMT